MRYGLVAVLRHLRKKAVRIDEGPRVCGLRDHGGFEGRVHPYQGLHHLNPVKGKEEIGLRVCGDSVVLEHPPQAEVVVPIAELHVEGAVDVPVVHLGVEALAARHGALPCGAAGGGRGAPPGGGGGGGGGGDAAAPAAPPSAGILSSSFKPEPQTEGALCLEGD